jgi:hypothetical protein
VKLGLLSCAALIVLGTAAHAQSVADISVADTIVYNRAGNEIGVIRGEADGGKAFVVLLSEATLGLGYYKVAIPRATMRPRPAGGWVTMMSNDALAYLPPTDHRYFQPSGD